LVHTQDSTLSPNATALTSPRPTSPLSSSRRWPLTNPARSATTPRRTGPAFNVRAMTTFTVIALPFLLLLDPCQRLNLHPGGKKFCLRYVEGHMQEHNGQSHHAIAVSYSDFSFWCYECDSYITSPVLGPLLKLGQRWWWWWECFISSSASSHLLPLLLWDTPIGWTRHPRPPNPNDIGIANRW